MHKIDILALWALPLFAGFFPQTVHTSISKVTNKSVTLNSSFPVNGMSGVVVHDYGNNLEAITSRIVQHASGKASLLDSDVTHHDKLPTIKTIVTPGDKVIGGYLYRNVLLLAPDAQTYAKITSIYDKNWVHPDLFALFLSTIGETVPTKENLKAFANSHQVGLVYILANGTSKLLDPISGQIVGQKPTIGLPTKGKAPFFMRLDEIKTGLFSSKNKESYYQIMSKF